MTVCDAICRSCGNSGVGIMGEPCTCKLPPEWQKEVHRLRCAVGQKTRINVEQLKQRDEWKHRYEQQKAYADACVKVDDARREEIALLKAEIARLESKT